MIKVGNTKNFRTNH